VFQEGSDKGEKKSGASCCRSGSIVDAMLQLSSPFGETGFMEEVSPGVRFVE